MTAFRFLVGEVQFTPRPIVWFRGFPPLPDETFDAYEARVLPLLSRKWAANSARRARRNRAIAIVGLPTITLIVLELTGYIAWPWWLVLSPVWIATAAIAVIVAAADIAEWICERAEKRAKGDS